MFYRAKIINIAIEACILRLIVLGKEVFKPHKAIKNCFLLNDLAEKFSPTARPC